MYDGSYIPGAEGPTLRITVLKVDNGYNLELASSPRRPQVVAPVPGAAEGVSPDEMIDRMVDGMGAFIRSVNDKGAGEDWKEDGDRLKIREAVKTFFPQLAQQAARAVTPEDFAMPRHESLVFESKQSLMKFLETNL